MSFQIQFQQSNQSSFLLLLSYFLRQELRIVGRNQNFMGYYTFSPGPKNFLLLLAFFVEMGIKNSWEELGFDQLLYLFTMTINILKKFGVQNYCLLFLNK
eukprot:TRINITY_DN3628_c0_g4_i1.p5 TRINITY_DN3628_c0_g4~~TRINITY_DN3628_c0_g4_i1.p5  ORF type:complete len:100 (-),score=2.65 TRINITY_DN3628_c0_g4_i1:746-1045(-)